jgi:hypothetical protein
VDPSARPEASNQKQSAEASPLAWLVAYTKPRWEKKLADQLAQKGFQNLKLLESTPYVQL